VRSSQTLTSTGVPPRAISRAAPARQAHRQSSSPPAPPRRSPRRRGGSRCAPAPCRRRRAAAWNLARGRSATSRRRCDHRDYRHAVADEGVELGQPVAAGAVAPDQPDLRLGPPQLRAQRESRRRRERAESAGSSHASGPPRPHDVEAVATKSPHVGDHHRVVGRRGVERAKKAIGLTCSPAAAACASISCSRAASRARSPAIHSGPPARARSNCAASANSVSPASPIAACPAAGSAGVGAAAVGGDQLRAGPHVLAVVEAEVAGHAASSTQSASRSALRRRGASAADGRGRAARAPCRTGTPGCRASRPPRDLRHPLDCQQRLAADDQQRPLRLRQRVRRGNHGPLGRVRDGGCRHHGRRHVLGARPACAPRAGSGRSAAAGRRTTCPCPPPRVPLPDQRAVVQQVDRALDEHRPRTPSAASRSACSTAPSRSRTRLTRKTFFTCGRSAASGRRPAARRAPAARWARRRRAAARALRQLRVLQRGDRVGQAGPAVTASTPGAPVSRAIASAANTGWPRRVCRRRGCGAPWPPPRSARCAPATG